MRNEKIMAIGYGHNGTAALMQNGKVLGCVSEERFNRIKNSTGFPELAVNYLKQTYGDDIDFYIFAERYSWGFRFLKKQNFRSTPYNDTYAKNPPRMSRKDAFMWKFFPEYFTKKKLQWVLSLTAQEDSNVAGQQEVKAYFANKLNVSEDKIIFLDHHLSHAYSSLFFKPVESKGKKTLAFTLDGEGDGLSATVNIWEKGKMERISKTSRVFSLGYLYREVTAFLGMKPDEHEFKVMGLAPYGKKEYYEKILPVFTDILWLNDKGEFESYMPIPQLSKFYFQEKLRYHRFDNIAGAVQEFTEKIVTDWIRFWINKTGITDVALSGGVFMNVKLNQKVCEMKEVSAVTITPSAGDESTVLGALWWAQENLFSETSNKPQSLSNLYLANEYTDKDIEDFLQKNGYYEKYQINKLENIEQEIAKLLASNKIVARYNGKMEFGARALGNRSILANPSSSENIRIINEMIKNRDFWMPFSASILIEDALVYVENPKNVNGSFMAVTFNTKLLAQEHLQAAIHPYDKTMRPQTVSKEQNPSYHKVISEFKKLTGIGGVLNTSFNLHGEPNVEKPADAMHTMEDSGLEYLAMGSFLIQKK